MNLEFHKNGTLTVEMKDYVKSMIDEFPAEEFNKYHKAATPTAEDLFETGSGPKLGQRKKEIFHTIVAKGLFVAKRARPDIHLTIALLCT